jgi:hypothetical protein
VGAVQNYEQLRPFTNSLRASRFLRCMSTSPPHAGGVLQTAFALAGLLSAFGNSLFELHQWQGTLTVACKTHYFARRAPRRTREFPHETTTRARKMSRIYVHFGAQVLSAQCKRAPRSRRPMATIFPRRTNCELSKNKLEFSVARSLADIDRSHHTTFGQWIATA